MKKLLLSGITAVALMTAGTAHAGVGLDLTGGTGAARTPLAMALAPGEFQIAADYVFSEDTFVPMRAAVGLPYGIEIGGAYWFTDTTPDDLDIWDLTAKWVLPKFVDNLSLAVGGHYNAFSSDDANVDNDGHDLYAVASYVAPVGEGMAVIPTAGFMWKSLTGDNDEDAWKFFGSLLLKAPQFAVGGEYLVSETKVDGVDDDFWWVGGRYYVNPMITLQAGYLNNADIGNDDIGDGVFHLGVQFAFASGMMK
jgi:hypothetical protein